MLTTSETELSSASLFSSAGKLGILARIFLLPVVWAYFRVITLNPGRGALSRGARCHEIGDNCTLVGDIIHPPDTPWQAPRNYWFKLY